MSLLPPPLSQSVLDSIRLLAFTSRQVDTIRSIEVLPGCEIELLCGQLLELPADPDAHSGAMDLLLRHFKTFLAPALIHTRLPLTLSEPDNLYSQPRPDLLVTKSPLNEARHPLPHEVQLIIELAAASLPIDARLKRDLYARSGILEYWIHDLNAGHLIVHRHPVDGAYTDVFTTVSASPLFAPEQTFTVPS